MQKWLTPREVAEALRVSVQTVYHMLEAGEIPSVRVRRQYRIAAEDLKLFISRQREPEE